MTHVGYNRRAPAQNSRKYCVSKLHRRGLKQSLARTGIHDFFVFFFLPPDFLSFTYKKLFCMKYKQALTVIHRHVHLKVWKIMQKIK